MTERMRDVNPCAGVVEYGLAPGEAAAGGSASPLPGRASRPGGPVVAMGLFVEGDMVRHL